MIAFIADAQKLDSADGEILLARHGTNGSKPKAKFCLFLTTVFSLKYFAGSLCNKYQFFSRQNSSHREIQNIFLSVSERLYQIQIYMYTLFNDVFAQKVDDVISKCAIYLLTVIFDNFL